MEAVGGLPVLGTLVVGTGLHSDFRKAVLTRKAKANRLTPCACLRRGAPRPLHVEPCAVYRVCRAGRGPQAAQALQALHCARVCVALSSSGWNSYSRYLYS